MHLMTRFITAALVACSIAFAAAADAQTASGRIPTVTRLVKIFLDREDQILSAQRSHDAATLERVLADDFEMRIGARPGVPIPRAEFLQQVGAQKVGPYTIEQMAVHDLGASMIVSFLLRPGADAADAQPLFVVDTWTGGTENPRLRIRYVAPAAAAAIPGAGAEPPPIPKKY